MGVTTRNSSSKSNNKFHYSWHVTDLDEILVQNGNRPMLEVFSLSLFSPSLPPLSPHPIASFSPLIPSSIFLLSHSPFLPCSSLSLLPPAQSKPAATSSPSQADGDAPVNKDKAIQTAIAEGISDFNPSQFASMLDKQLE